MDIELMKAAVTLEGVLSGTSALALFAEVEALTAENARIFAMVDAREQTIAELTALCDGYRGEVERLKVDRECHRIQAVDRGNSYQKAAAEIKRLQGIVTALEEGCYSCQHPKRVEELEPPAVFDEWWNSTKYGLPHWKQPHIFMPLDIGRDSFAAGYRLGKRSKDSALTRARAEGMEKAVGIVAAVAELSAPCWCKEDDLTGEGTVCDCCNMLANIEDALKAAAKGGNSEG